MVKLAKYLKPFAGLIIAAVLLLFVQAMADLALPDYMSDIVNKGIQQGGIVNAVPDAVRESQMNRLTIFMNEDDKSEILKNYTLINSSSSDYDKYVKKYPALEKEPVYVLNDVDKSEIEKMDLPMGKALLAVSGVEKLKESAKDGVIDLNGMKVPGNMDLFKLFADLSQEQRVKISENMSKQFEALGEKMIIQTAAPSVKAEYEALGMDTDNIQSRYIINTGLLMLLISLLSAACTIAVGFLSARAAAGLSRNLRKEVFTKV